MTPEDALALYGNLTDPEARAPDPNLVLLGKGTLTEIFANLVYKRWLGSGPEPGSKGLPEFAEEMVDEFASMLFSAVETRVEQIATESHYRETFGRSYDPRQAPPGYYVHSKAPPKRIFPHESYAETARKDGVA